MIQKTRTLLFLTLVLTIGTCSVKATDELLQEKKQGRNLPKQYKKDYNPVIEEELNEFGVPRSEYEYTISFYSKLDNRNNFDILMALVIKIPENNRKEALFDFESRVGSCGYKLNLDQYHSPSEFIMTDSPYKPANTLKLRDALLNLEYQPR